MTKFMCQDDLQIGVVGGREFVPAEVNAVDFDINLVDRAATETHRGQGRIQAAVAIIAALVGAPGDLVHNNAIDSVFRDGFVFS